MLSFVKNSEIKVLINEKHLPKNKKKFVPNEDICKLVQFNKRELELLKELNETSIKDESDNEKSENDEIELKKEEKVKQKSLTLRELKDLKQQLGEEIFLCDILEKSSAVLELPKNEIVERNPELEERIQRLKAEQANREYNSMTRNVDSRRKNHDPKDSIGYQIKQINRQLIAVAQFVFSVISGFAFGFLGIQLIVGNLDFGFRLLLGIICALIIALAEIYFLAKKLIEEEDADEQQSTPNKSYTAPKSSVKVKTN
ncbi:hypothetical protein PVAND_003904 [Polypedilum vanderplanki]|uniref:Transmembrane protein n=1 Tax=Polypedilum vanderplanki TaxID=319348 RepID=A0A9J6BVG8_POLVA|nr:hypothetical protein PVAND_003904 [Polypedilum vanderplanki]